MEYVTRAHYPDAINTTPVMFTKGERVLTIAQKLQGLSNEELVRRVSLIVQLGLDMNAMWSELGAAPMILPSGIVGSDGSLALDLSELTTESRSRTAIENQKLLQVTIDKDRFSTSEIGRSLIVRHYDNILTI